MKKTILLILVCITICTTYSQDAAVEKSVFGIQTGILGIWAHNEFRLSDKIALRTELGLDAGIFIGGPNDGKLAFVPALTLEPRWYYNLNRRVDKGKRIDGNTGNFISIKTTYHPDLFVINNPDNVNFISDLSIIPTYGIRRHIGKHFNYEAGFGIGYVWYLEDSNTIGFEEDEVAVNLHLRIG